MTLDVDLALKSMIRILDRVKFRINNGYDMQIDSNTKVVILTGAGISAESGLKTFRDADGLWENHAIECCYTVCLGARS